MRPWIERASLIKDAKDFIRQNGYFLSKYSNRIASLVEVAVYNSVVAYYQERGFDLKARNLGPKKSFRYKISSAGYAKNFSYFEARDKKSNVTVTIYHNTKIQSAHHDHLYYSPDVAVCEKGGNVTKELRSGRLHSFISREHLLCFVEVKHLPPFPEALFSFTGLVQEFMPDFIAGKIATDRNHLHLSPILVFTGVASDHSETIRSELIKRYGINIVYGTQSQNGRIANFDDLRKYKRRSESRQVSVMLPYVRRFKFEE